MLFVSLLGIVAAGACGSSTPALVVAPVEPQVVVAREAAPLADAAAPEGARVCSGVLRVGPVVPIPGSCWIDERVGKKTAPFTYPCTGGAATADFGTRFEGAVDASGNVRLEATTTFHWSGDGCTWQSVQRIGGNLGAGELVYTYDEHSIEGSSCAPAECVARVPVRVASGPGD